MTLYLSHDISYGCTVINDSFIENALPRNFIKTTIHVIQPRAPNSRNTSLLSMQFSNGYDSDTGENRWTSVLNISFENWHLSLYKSWSTHSSYSVGCLWQATVSFRVNFFFIVDAKRQIWLTAETIFISKQSAISHARTVISKHNFCKEHSAILRFWQGEEINMNRN